MKTHFYLLNFSEIGQFNRTTSYSWEIISNYIHKKSWDQKNLEITFKISKNDSLKRARNLSKKKRMVYIFYCLNAKGNRRKKKDKILGNLMNF